MSFKKLHVLILVAVVLVWPGVSYAHAQEDDSVGVAPNTAEAIKERVERRKAALKIQLDRGAENRMKSRCKAAQNLLDAAHDRSDEAKSRRLKAYENLVSRLDKVIEKLKASNVDATVLEGLKAELATKVEVLKAALDSYHVALGDAVQLQCTEDPAGFKASLDNSRTLNQQVGGLYKDIRTLIKDQIIPTINDLKPSNE